MFSYSLWKRMIIPCIFTTAICLAIERGGFQGPLHEAFLSSVGKDLILEAVDLPPPNPIRETIPKLVDKDKIWIRGYWDWDRKNEQYVWICGIWRKPPAYHEWIEGYWKKFDAGWVRIPGFWSSTPLSYLEYISTSPPDAYDENVKEPPGDGLFFVPGYWDYDRPQDTYSWVKGKWQSFNPDFVLVPSHYVFREQGYVFVPAFWDWPLDKVGVAFCSVSHPGDDFTPEQSVKDVDLFAYYFCYYPYYMSYIRQHFYFHTDFWKQCCSTPSWWWWDSWWCIPWWGHWQMWWWWCHPGFPCPPWLESFATWINEPNPALFSWWKHLIKPLIVSPNGVILPQRLLNTIVFVSGSHYPFLSKDSLGKIFSLAEPLPIGPKDIRPQGNRQKSSPEKPWIDRGLTPLLSHKENRIPPLPDFEEVRSEDLQEEFFPELLFEETPTRQPPPPPEFAPSKRVIHSPLQKIAPPRSPQQTPIPGKKTETRRRRRPIPKLVDPRLLTLRERMHVRYQLRRQALSR